MLLDPSPVVGPVVSSSLPWSAGVAQAMGRMTRAARMSEAYRISAVVEPEGGDLPQNVPAEKLPKLRLTL